MTSTLLCIINQLFEHKIRQNYLLGGFLQTVSFPLKWLLQYRVQWAHGLLERESDSHRRGARGAEHHLLVIQSPHSDHPHYHPFLQLTKPHRVKVEHLVFFFYPMVFSSEFKKKFSQILVNRMFLRFYSTMFFDQYGHTFSTV